MATLRDGRRRPQIGTATVWLAVFAMFAVRLRSLNALEQELRRPGRWARWVGSRRLPSADTVGRVLNRLELAEQRQLVTALNRQAWRRKAIHGRPGAAYRVVAVDGHELWASRARCCDECLVRQVPVGGVKVAEYYHRVVVAQWVGVTPPALLDIERVRPHEGEVVAGRRLVARVVETYGRLLDVITADALYLEAPFIRTVLDAGKHVVVVLKQEARELYQDADGLRAMQAPTVREEGARTTRLWDLPALTSFTTLERPVRVVWAEERTTKRQYRGGQLREVVEEHRWIWVTDLSSEVVPARLIQQWGHDRWDLENRGFNELTMLWHMDHCFIHQPRAIEAVLLTLATAFLLTYLFYGRNLKPVARRHLTRLALAARLLEGFALSGASLWPEVQRSD
ncbi:MAG: transposase [candidate division NC10 bacterium]